MTDKMWLCLVFLISLGLTCAIPAEAGFEVSKNGTARCVIVRQPGATEAEAHAAGELAATLTQVTGAPLALRDAPPAPPGRAIVVGPGPVAARLFPEINFTRLGGEDVLIRTKGRFLLLAGGRPRGTLYAVSRFLQGRCGVRWWTPWASTVPHRPSLVVPDLAVRERPAFEYREPFWFPAFDSDWAVRHFYNGESAHLTKSLGGKITYKGFVHTFYSLVPPDKCFKDHPEWYSLVNGKRTADHAQLCLSNPQLREFVAQRVEELLRESPEANIVSVSQNDNLGACECPVCKPIDEAEGSHAGTLIPFVNDIAQRIERDHPHVAIDTLAYQYTRRPPRTARPRHNVIVRLCSIECNFAAPLDDPSNASFAQDIRDWSKICDRLYVWDYVTNFAHYVQPHPNWFSLGPNVRFFRRHHVKGVFEEGAKQSNGPEMAELRAWVLAQLLWNPDQDDKALIDEFLTGYCGPAAPFVRRYLTLMHTASRGYYLGINSSPDAPFLKFPTLANAERLWQKAEAAVAARPDLLWRVRQGHLPVRYVWLVRWSQLQRAAYVAGAPWPLPASRKAVAAAWLATATGPGPAGWSSMKVINEPLVTPGAFAARFSEYPPAPAGDPKRYRNPSAPVGLSEMDTRQGVDVQEGAANLVREGEYAEVRLDAAASDGAAVWMSGRYHDWAFQLPVSKLPERARTGTWKVYAMIRVQKKPGAHSDTKAFTAGVWDVAADVSRGDIAVTVADSPDGYRSYLLGAVDFKPGQYIWAAPTANPDVEAVSVDRVYLVPAPQRSGNVKN